MSSLVLEKNRSENDDLFCCGKALILVADNAMILIFRLGKSGRQRNICTALPLGFRRHVQNVVTGFHSTQRRINNACLVDAGRKVRGPRMRKHGLVSAGDRSKSDTFRWSRAGISWFRVPVESQVFGQECYMNAIGYWQWNTRAEAADQGNTRIGGFRRKSNRIMKAVRRPVLSVAVLPSCWQAQLCDY